MLPGIPTTNKRVQVPQVVVVRFREGRLAHEHIYWDQRSILKQIGLISDASPPIFGAETAQRVVEGANAPHT
jgi:carboxymethylenebutenolidase